MNALFRNDSRENESRIHQWENSNLDLDGLVHRVEKKYESINFSKFPRRQIRSGRSHGLSVLLDPDLKELFCTNTDAVGFQVQQFQLSETKYFLSHVN